MRIPPLFTPLHALERQIVAARTGTWRLRARVRACDSRSHVRIEEALSRAYDALQTASAAADEARRLEKKIRAARRQQA